MFFAIGVIVLEVFVIMCHTCRFATKRKNTLKQKTLWALARTGTMTLACIFHIAGLIYGAYGNAWHIAIISLMLAFGWQFIEAFILKELIEQEIYQKCKRAD